MATGSERNSLSSNYVPTGTHDNTWRPTMTISPVGAWKGKTQRAAKEETATNQYVAFHGIKGDRGTRGYEEGNRVHVTPERPRGGQEGSTGKEALQGN